MIPGLPTLTETPLGLAPVFATPADAATAPFAPMLLDAQSGIGRATIDAAPASAAPALAAPAIVAPVLAAPAVDAAPLIDAEVAPDAHTAPAVPAASDARAATDAALRLLPPTPVAQPAAEPAIDAAALVQASPAAKAPALAQPPLVHLVSRAGVRAPLPPMMSGTAAVAVDQGVATPDPVDGDVADTSADRPMHSAADGAAVVLPDAVVLTPTAIVPPVAPAPLPQIVAEAPAAAEQVSMAGLVAQSVPVVARGIAPLALAVADAQPATEQDDAAPATSDAALTPATVRPAAAPVANLLQMIGAVHGELNQPMPVVTATGPAAASAAASTRPDLALDVTGGDAWIAQIVGDLARLKSPSDALHFRLHPANLGTLAVRLSQQDGQTQLILSVETAAAQRQLADSRPQLVEAASNNGVEFKELRIDLAANTGGQPDGSAPNRRPYDPQSARMFANRPSDATNDEPQDSAFPTAAPARGATYRFA